MSGKAAVEEAQVEAWPDESFRWTTEQHRLMACRLLDGNHASGLGEYSEDPADPPWRHYTATDDDEGSPADLGPFLAALTHALLSRTAAPESPAS